MTDPEVITIQCEALRYMKHSPLGTIDLEECSKVDF